MYFVAKRSAEKKEDNINNDGTILDLQVTNLFLSMGGQDAIIKFRRLISLRNLIDTPYKDIRLLIQNYISTKERVGTAERVKFLSVIQDIGESDDIFSERLGEEARYCDLEKPKTAANHEKGLVKKIISALRDTEAKLRLLDGIKAKPAISVTEMTENLKFRSQAMAFQVLHQVISLFL